MLQIRLANVQIIHYTYNFSLECSLFYEVSMENMTNQINVKQVGRMHILKTKTYLGGTR